MTETKDSAPSYHAVRLCLRNMEKKYKGNNIKLASPDSNGVLLLYDELGALLSFHVSEFRWMEWIRADGQAEKIKTQVQMTHT